MIRASAGTWSPASRRITSPGTRAAAATFLRTPSRSTAAWGVDILRSSSRACWAWSSWVMEMMLFTTTITRMITLSSQSSPPLAARDRAAAARRTRIMGSFSWPNIRMRRAGGSGWASWLGPTRSRRWAASRLVRPWGLPSSSRITWSSPLLCQSPIPSLPIPNLFQVYPQACPLFGEISRERKRIPLGTPARCLYYLCQLYSSSSK